MKTSQTNKDARQLFESISKDLVRSSDTTKAKMFGAPGIRVGKKFFSCLFKNELVLKLPQKRVQSLVKSGAGKYFDPGMGRPMKDWISLTPTTKEEWLKLAVESRDYVASLEKAKK